MSDHTFNLHASAAGETTTPHTSVTHPLRFDVLSETPDHRSVLSLTLQPGKKGRGQTNTVWDRDVVTDLRAIQKAGYKFLVSLLTDVRSFFCLTAI